MESWVKGAEDSILFLQLLLSLKLFPNKKQNIQSPYVKECRPISVAKDHDKRGNDEPTGYLKHKEIV